MRKSIQLVGYALALGIMATAFLDIVNALRHWLVGPPLTRYDMIGRWVLYMFEGTFHHTSISASAPMQGEMIMGWFGHYAIGVLFALILLGGWGISWLHRPTLLAAMVVGMVTTVIPYFLMQPGMGAGIAGTLSPNPTALQVKVLISHAIFGFGLYVGGWLIRGFSLTDRR